MSESVELPPVSGEVRAALDAATDVGALQEIVRADPLCLEAWARLGRLAYDAADDVASYAYCRVGYHRGLDVLRSNGWRPDREVRWAYEGNRGFLLALHGLMRAAAAIGEGVEARRCREFLLQLDPTDPLEVGAIQPKDLSRRLS
ncbi:MAG TPA: DUF3151 family protein [Actinomycetota bacterium]|nr:DUF3151 family protein [Actinomycetota bacterium]